MNAERVDSKNMHAWAHLSPYNATNSSDSCTRIIRIKHEPNFEPLVVVIQ